MSKSCKRKSFVGISVFFVLRKIFTKFHIDEYLQGPFQLTHLPQGHKVKEKLQKVFKVGCC